MKIMNWPSLLSSKRIGDRPAKVERGRSPFNSDHDKIIFSGAFRRLAKKTQVHPLASNDHVHNRLTHSLEVACLGRTLGMRVGQILAERQKIENDISPSDIGDIVQSACLAHDIGNPPFGHTGESAVRSWFKSDGARFLAELNAEEANDLRTFEGNAQGLRILTSAEYHPYDGGMRLTYATLGSFIKYPWTSLPAVSGNRPKNDKFGVFQSELSTFHEVASAVGLVKQPGDDWYSRHPLVYLMEAADDFCYALLDLEDALEMGIMSWDDVYDIIKPVLTKADRKEFKGDLKELRPGRRTPVVRGRVMEIYVEAAAAAFVENEQLILKGDKFDLVASCDSVVASSVASAKSAAREKIFNHPRKIELEIGSYSVISTLLQIMCDAVEEYTRRPQRCSFKTKRVIDLIGPNTFHPKLFEQSEHTPQYLAYMRVIDFISGCTDQYATYLAKQFNGMGEAR